MLRPYKDEFWFSISDSDVLLWLQGLNVDNKWNVEIDELDVAPVQIQGPKSTALLMDVYGPEIENIPYYGLMHVQRNGYKAVISRTGWSTERGYEIYL